MQILKKVAIWLLIIGGLNYLLVAFGTDVIGMLGSTIAMIVDVLIGLAAIFKLVMMFMPKSNSGAPMSSAL